MSFVIDLGPVFKRVDNAIQRINQWITVKKTYCAIHQITIYPVDSVIQNLNNRALMMELSPVTSCLGITLINEGFEAHAL